MNRIVFLLFCAVAVLGFVLADGGESRCEPPRKVEQVKVEVRIIPMGPSYILEARTGKDRLPLDEEPAAAAIHQVLKKEGWKVVNICRYGKEGEPLSFMVEKVGGDADAE